jgi:catechol 2,3-dioxygenase-like lactoylglutathione lyase family enzyme
MQSFSIHHIMIPVGDLDCAIDFYTRLFGMGLISRKTFAAREVEIAMVGYGTPPGPPQFELVKNLAADAPTPMPLPNHIAIDVGDLAALCNALKAENVTFTEPFAARPDGRGFSAWIRDRDGHALQLSQRG